MLFLLRNMRRKMLSKNQLLTYVLYGIGEIFLVVIGILIAVQIDEWNEQRKLKEKETAYYTKLLEDIQQDASQVKKLLSETETRILHANLLLSLLQQEVIDTRAVANEMLEAISLVTFTFKPSTAAFDDLKSSGNLGLLDEKIIKDLRDYYANIEGIVDVVDINSDQAVRLFYDTQSYAKIGWPLIDFVEEAIDDQLIDKNDLFNRINADDDYREELISDAIYFIGSGARVKMLYQNLLLEIQQMEMILIQQNQPQTKE